MHTTAQCEMFATYLLQLQAILAKVALNGCHVALESHMQHHLHTGHAGIHAYKTDQWCAG